MTNRVTHQIISRIFAIFLKEIYRFDKIYLDDSIVYSYLLGEYNEHYAVYAPLTNIIMPQNGVENPAVNLEVLLPPSFHVSFPPNVVQGGSLIRNDLFRYGLYVLSATATRTYSYRDFMKGNHRYTNISKEFKVSQKEIEGMDKYLDKSNGFKGFFEPQWCNSTSEPCAVVLTSFYNDTKFFIDHINEFNLKLKVFFLGDRLMKVVRDINDRNLLMMKPGFKQQPFRFLVLHWTPSEIIDSPSLNFDEVEMPRCELYLNENRTCRYEVVPVLTIMNDLAKNSEGFSDLMYNVHFPSLKPILNIYNEYLPRVDKIYLKKDINETENDSLENIYNEVACRWLQENDRYYSTTAEDKWIKLMDNEIEVYIGGL